jgi:hypothetical protein
MKAVLLPKVIADKIQQAPAQVLGDGASAKANSSSFHDGSRRQRPKHPTRPPSRNGHLSTA